MEARHSIWAAPSTSRLVTVDFAGGAGTNTNCTQVIGNTVTFTGNSGLAINCAGYGVKPITPTGVRLVS